MKKATPDIAGVAFLVDISPVLSARVAHGVGPCQGL